MQTALRFSAHVLAGFVLMFLAHFAAFLGTRHGLPYWWAYLVLYPVSAAGSAKLEFLPPGLTAIGLCLAPAIYFTALGVTDGNWQSSNTAIIGVSLAFVLSLAFATLFGRARKSSGAAA